MDGPAGAGKSTAAQGLAQRLGAVRLDTGAIYRAVALQARRQGVSWEDGAALGPLAAALPLRFDSQRAPQGVWLGGEDVTAAIRHPDISRGASRVSRHPEVRQALQGLQRRLGSEGLVVAEGRDMGTTVFPDALVKLYLTASDEERARRRWEELRHQPDAPSLAGVLAEQRERDRQDRERAVSPLRRAPDAVVVDSTDLSLAQVIQRMAQEVQRALEGRAAAAAGARGDPQPEGLAGAETAAETAGEIAPDDDAGARRRELTERLARLEQELAEREQALPAHSVRPHQLQEIEELEEEIANLRSELKNP